MNTTKELKYYEDVTETWIEKANLEKGIVEEAKSITLNGKEYFVNDKNRINYKNREKYIANLIVNTFGGRLQYLPDIGEEDNIRCGDFFYEEEIWDLKEIGNHAKSKIRAIDNALKMSKGQANNFILDITEARLSRKNILQQVEKIYSTKNRGWIDKIIIFDNDKLIKVYKKRG